MKLNSKESKVSGIYCIENSVNNKKYIGSSINIYNRYRTHKAELKKGKSHSPILQNEWNEYGEENFEIYIVEVCGQTNLLDREEYHISTMNTKFPHGYNLTDYGSGAGRVVSEKERKIMSERRGIKSASFGKKSNLSKSKYYGVRQSKVGDITYWRAQVRVNAKTIYIGNYKDEIIAAHNFDYYIIENNLPNPLNFPDVNKRSILCG